MAAAARTVEKLLLAAPRGYCAGVDRAVQTVERALELHGAPVYVRKEIVHNKHVVEKLRERGAVFVEELDALEVADPAKVAYVSQTTLSVDETRAIIGRLRERFPAITGPRTDDICYATTNRQAAVKQLAQHCDLVLVIGSRNSSNSQRLVEVARDYGAEAHLIDNEHQVRDEWLDDKRVVGISSGASAPEELVQRLVDFFRDRGVEDVAELEVVSEDVRFMLPKPIRTPAAASAVPA